MAASVTESHDERLYIARSTVHGAGMGVFAAEAMSEGTHLGYYRGRVFHKYPKRNKRNFAYILEICRRPPWLKKETWKKKGHPIYVDGTCVLSRINCCRGNEDCWNCDITAVGGFVLNADVQPHEEILIHYGDDYWNSDNEPELDPDAIVEHDSDDDKLVVEMVPKVLRDSLEQLDAECAAIMAEPSCLGAPPPGEVKVQDEDRPPVKKRVRFAADLVQYADVTDENDKEQDQGGGKKECESLAVQVDISKQDRDLAVSKLAGAVPLPPAVAVSN